MDWPPRLYRGSDDDVQREIVARIEAGAGAGLNGVCGGPVSSQQVSRHGWTGQVYSCLKKRCAAVKAEILDEYVQRAVVHGLPRRGAVQG